jgi:hypothetical protein
MSRIFCLFVPLFHSQHGLNVVHFVGGPNRPIEIVVRADHHARVRLRQEHVQQIHETGESECSERASNEREDTAKRRAQSQLRPIFQRQRNQADDAQQRRAFQHATRDQPDTPGNGIRERREWLTERAQEQASDKRTEEPGNQSRQRQRIPAQARHEMQCHPYHKEARPPVELQVSVRLRDGEPPRVGHKTQHGRQREHGGKGKAAARPNEEGCAEYRCDLFERCLMRRVLLCRCRTRRYIRESR